MNNNLKLLTWKNIIAAAKTQIKIMDISRFNSGRAKTRWQTVFPILL